VDYNRADSAVDSLTLSERFSEGGVGAVVGGLTRRQLLLAGGGAATIGIGAGAIVLSNNTVTETNGGPEAGGDGGIVAAVSIPETPGKFRYATMGSTESDLGITYFGSWKCPYCAQFSTEMLPQLVADYVEPGTISVEFRNLAYIGGEPFLGPDAPAAGQAGLAVWNAEPASYWPFHEYVFENQPPEREQWATPDRLVDFARSSGVSNTDAVRTAIQETQYEDALQATDGAARESGVNSTPTLLIDGTTINPLGNEDRTRRLIEDATGQG
jgi:protein-disulfide isomerase